MTNTFLLVIALCAVVVTVVLVPTLLALKRMALRAETVLMLLEREIRPTASQLQALAEELRGLSKHAAQEVERAGAVIGRVDEVATRVAQVVGFVGGVTGFVGGFTRVGQLVGTATGVKKGLDVFIKKLISRNKKHEAGRVTDE
ncbi:MAG: hypothetical protein A3I03_10375 [Candidatus Rokubacteria bacterium RIFCSPLOWO2_02_FULL_68_19]|nr:MAG: hypothetical protein A3J45_05930 [Candidatus Rokubacteria bacterium RIFCSPHIGHO2_02_FULL_69_13]OGL05765.1 MAG: hypothetical protein A3I03_10375 [Candidatus Rokubacteria bacterium RIFCSPLOWO2_02_FULL_68_19]